MYYDLCLNCNDIVNPKKLSYDTNGEPVCPHCKASGTMDKERIQIVGNGKNINIQRDCVGFFFVYKNYVYYLDSLMKINDTVSTFPKWLQSFDYIHYYPMYNIVTPVGKPRSGILARIGVGSTVKVYSFTIY